MDVPEIRYARSGDVSIAYMVVGEGPSDLVYVPGFVSSIDLSWDNPWRASAYKRLSSFCRLIMFDKRGTGLSDRVTGIPGLEERMDDVRAVMDAAGSERAALLGISEGGAMSMLYAATYPERTAALVLFGASPRFVWSPDFPWAPTRDEFERSIENLERHWGTPELAEELFMQWAPSMSDDPVSRRSFARVMRVSASPAAAGALQRMNMDIDVRAVLPSIHVPTLLLHRTNQRPDIRGARYVADRIAGARLVELPGADQTPFGRDVDRVFEEVEGFLRDAWAEAEARVEEPERVLATILFTDIVGSTAKAAELGDARWRELLREHHAIVRRHLGRFRGQEVDTAGDGFFASFDGPARAIRCARTISESVRTLGIEVRAGLHTGECEVVEGKVGGIAVHIGARVAAQADAGEVLVSSTVKDLVAGSGLSFADRGAAELKGVPGEWRLYAVEGA